METRAGPVLVGTDFSESARMALTEARRLAELLGTRLEVLHVVEGGITAGWGDAGEAGQWLRGAGLEPDDLVVRHGSAWVELSRYAAEVAPVLVVVGSHGRSGYQPLAIGSTAARVAVHARRPVVLVSPRVVSGQEQTAADTVRDGAAVVSGDGRIDYNHGGKRDEA
jgi:nucleotide-binding universal stress UspA family protein